MTLGQWENLFRTNITSMFLTCRAAIPLFLARGEGSIVNISSVWGLSGASCETAYSASKGAVNTFTRALAKELAPSHIRVNAAAFGVIDTEMNSFLSPDERQSLTDEIPEGRFGSAEEAAGLHDGSGSASPLSDGQVITMDGGGCENSGLTGRAERKNRTARRWCCRRMLFQDARPSKRFRTFAKSGIGRGETRYRSDSLPFQCQRKNPEPQDG